MYLVTCLDVSTTTIFKLRFTPIWCVWYLSPAPNRWNFKAAFSHTKRIKCLFSTHTTPAEPENATFSGYFVFVFQELNWGWQITWSLWWCHPFRNGCDTLCLLHNKVCLGYSGRLWLMDTPNKVVIFTQNTWQGSRKKQRKNRYVV